MSQQQQQQQSYLEQLFSLNGKVAVLTGGTRGIGQALAIALAKAGADIVLIQRDPSNLETLSRVRAEAPARRAWIVPCDLAERAQLAGVVRRIVGPESEGGLALGVDVLVNCGGVQRRHRAEVFPDDDWQEVLQVNLNAVWTLARDVGHHMLARRASYAAAAAAEGRTKAEDAATGAGADHADDTERALPRGKIINVASLLSYQGGYTVPAYAAAKHGVLGLTKALSNEWSSKGINVNGIAPGYIDTEMNTALLADPARARAILERIPAARWGAPADVAGAAVFLAGGAADYVCGETLVVDGGWMGR